MLGNLYLLPNEPETSPVLSPFSLCISLSLSFLSLAFSEGRRVSRKDGERDREKKEIKTKPRLRPDQDQDQHKTRRKPRPHKRRRGAAEVAKLAVRGRPEGERTVRKHRKSLGLLRRKCSTRCIALRRPGAPFEEKGAGLVSGGRVFF